MKPQIDNMTKEEILKLITWYENELKAMREIVHEVNEKCKGVVKIQKFEKIEKMASEFCNTNYENIKQMHADYKRTCSAVSYCIEISWQMAEQFYDYVKQKQEEANDV